MISFNGNGKKSSGKFSRTFLFLLKTSSTTFFFITFIPFKSLLLRNVYINNIFKFFFSWSIILFLVNDTLTTGNEFYKFGKYSKTSDTTR